MGYLITQKFNFGKAIERLLLVIYFFFQYNSLANDVVIRRSNSRCFVSLEALSPYYS